MKKIIKKEEKKVAVKRGKTVNNLVRNIYFASGKLDKGTPKLLIEGNWLKEYGFEVGKTYQLMPEQNKIVIKINA